MEKQTSCIKCKRFFPIYTNNSGGVCGVAGMERYISDTFANSLGECSVFEKRDEEEERVLTRSW